MPLDLSALVLLRPDWLYGLLALPLLGWLLWWRRPRGSAWEGRVDAHLLPHLLEGGGDRPRPAAGSVLALLAAGLALLALAGPSWRANEAPLWQLESPLAVALDLSSAMRAADLPPSRLVQARAKIERLLEQRRDGQVALIAYAGDAFTVAPLTPDGRSLRLLLASLAPELMPLDGQRPERAIRHAVSLLKAAGFDQGEILLLSDRAGGEAQQAAATALAAGFRVSVLGVGTLAGAPVLGKSGFMTDAAGQPRLARLDPGSLRALAEAGGGRYLAMTLDDSDLHALGVLDPRQSASLQRQHPEQQAQTRSDDGYWLVLALLPLVLLGFRRGWLALAPPLLLGASLLLAPHPQAAAEESAEARSAQLAGTGLESWWAALWQRRDQRAQAALQAGATDTARRLAADPDWQAAAAYRDGDFAAASANWATRDQASAHYNRGNALARSGDLQGALQAYDQALALQPGMADAEYNRAIVEQAMLQQEQQEQQGQQGEQERREQEPQDRQEQDGQPSGDRQQDEESGQDQSAESAARDGEESSSQQQEQGEEGETGEQDPREASDAEPKNAEAAAEEAARREAAEAAAREQMQAALDAAAEEEGEERAELSPEERAREEQRQAVEHWLRRVPDDPGGLLRRKFELEYRRRVAAGDVPYTAPPQEPPR